MTKIDAPLPALALHGGAPEITSPPVPPKRWGEAEREQLDAMLGQSSLFYWKGPQTELLVQRFKEHYPLDTVMPCSSGTAAIHIAVAAAGLKPGDEVIVPPITDMGTVIGVLYQQGVPVFSDLDPRSYNLDPESVRKQITSRTRAIVIVHLAGNPCPMEPFHSLAKEFNLILIEDCAQAWGALWNGQPVGTFGHFGCYSLNDFKHIASGEGGLVGTSEARFAPLLQKCGDKYYDRAGGMRAPEGLAPNYRISEPQSAVAAGQMKRLPEIARRRHALGSRLLDQISDVSGILPPKIAPEAFCTWWFHLFRLEQPKNVDHFVSALQAEGVLATRGYIPTPIYRYPVFQNHNFFGGHWPVKEMGLTQMDYREVHCPSAEAILNSCIYLKMHEGMSENYIDGVARSIRKVAANGIA